MHGIHNLWAIGLLIAGVLGIAEQARLAWVAVFVTALLAIVT